MINVSHAVFAILFGSAGGLRLVFDFDAIPDSPEGDMDVGQLTKGDKAQKEALRIMLAADANSDRQLSKQEANDYMQANSGSTLSRFRTFDRDQSDTLDFDELTALLSASPAADSHVRPTAQFQSLIKNASSLRNASGPSPFLSDGSEHDPELLAMRILTFADKNLDQQIDQDEATTFAETGHRVAVSLALDFQSFDVDGNARLDFGELTSFTAALAREEPVDEVEQVRSIPSASILNFTQPLNSTVDVNLSILNFTQPLNSTVDVNLSILNFTQPLNANVDANLSEASSSLEEMVSFDAFAMSSGWPEARSAALGVRTSMCVAALVLSVL